MTNPNNQDQITADEQAYMEAMGNKTLEELRRYLELVQKVLKDKEQEQAEEAIKEAKTKLEAVLGRAPTVAEEEGLKRLYSGNYSNGDTENAPSNDTPSKDNTHKWIMKDTDGNQVAESIPCKSSHKSWQSKDFTSLTGDNANFNSALLDVFSGDITENDGRVTITAEFRNKYKDQLKLVDIK